MGLWEDHWVASPPPCPPGKTCVPSESLRVLTSDQMPHLGEGGGTRALPWPWGKAGGVSDTRMLGTDRGLHLGLCELEGSGRAQPRIDDQGRGPPG